MQVYFSLEFPMTGIPYNKRPTTIVPSGCEEAAEITKWTYAGSVGRKCLNIFARYSRVYIYILIFAAHEYIFAIIYEEHAQ